MKNILIAVLASVALTACDEGSHTYICDGEVNNGKDKNQSQYKSLYEKSVKYSYSCRGTNVITALIGTVFDSNGCNVEIANIKLKKAYYSEVNTVETMEPLSSFNPRTMKLKYWIKEYDGNEHQFIGTCK